MQSNPRFSLLCRRTGVFFAVHFLFILVIRHGCSTGYAPLSKMMMHLASICIGLIAAVACLSVLVFMLFGRLRQQDSQLRQYHRTFFHQQHQLQIFQDLLAQLSQQGGATPAQLHGWIDGLAESEFYATFLWDDLLDESGEVLALYGTANLPLRRLARSRQASRQGLMLLSDSYIWRQHIYYQMRRHLASVDPPSTKRNT